MLLRFPFFAVLVAILLPIAGFALPPKALIVVAHPDDESEMAATVYRIAREQGGIVDQVIITDGEAGYRYSLLAERVYGVQLTDEKVGRKQLPAIRRQETINAGKILGIRKHYFLNQRDTRYSTDPNEVLNGAWDRSLITSFLKKLLQREHYDVVFTLLPVASTHGHHQAATILALQVVNTLPVSEQPLVLGAQTTSIGHQPSGFSGTQFPLTATVLSDPVFTFDRAAHFGFNNALSYEIVVNWMIAEHKSQGLFQTECGRHTGESFWLFRLGGSHALERAGAIFRGLAPDDVSLHSLQVAGLK